MRWKDGDTPVLDVDLGFGLRFIDPDGSRVYGLDAAETHTTDAAEKARGAADAEHARRLCPEGTRVRIRTYKNLGGPIEKDKFGRYLPKITLPDGRDFAATMIADGHGRAYYGGAR